MRSSMTRRRMLTIAWSIACWLRHAMASAGLGTGWTSPTMPRRMATIRTPSAKTPGRIAIT